MVDETGLVKELRVESLHLFPQRMRDGHAYHHTAFLVDRAAARIEALQQEVEKLQQQIRVMGKVAAHSALQNGASNGR